MHREESEDHPEPGAGSPSSRQDPQLESAGRDIARMVGIALEGIKQLLDSQGWNSTEAMALRTLSKILEKAKIRAERLGE